tara:strand:+ start:24429 stop:24632 length:204 start_codon:yes stop_codon:yes gene_type:complete
MLADDYADEKWKSDGLHALEYSHWYISLWGSCCALWWRDTCRKGFNTPHEAKDWVEFMERTGGKGGG